MRPSIFFPSGMLFRKRIVTHLLSTGPFKTRSKLSIHRGHRRFSSARVQQNCSSLGDSCPIGSTLYSEPSFHAAAHDPLRSIYYALNLLLDTLARDSLPILDSEANDAALLCVSRPDLDARYLPFFFGERTIMGCFEPYTAHFQPREERPYASGARADASNQIGGKLPETAAVLPSFVLLTQSRAA
jgi:hypothetical protein